MTSLHRSFHKQTSKPIDDTQQHKQRHL